MINFGPFKIKRKCNFLTKKFSRRSKNTILDTFYDLLLKIIKLNFNLLVHLKNP